MEPIPDLAVDLGPLGPDLAPELPPFAGAQGPDAATTVQAALAELNRLMPQMVALGAVERLADGSFRPVGYVDPRQAQIDRQGSECRCPECPPYNQNHWYCAGCFSGPHSWHSDKPSQSPVTRLHEGGKDGMAWQFCSPQCKVLWQSRRAQSVPRVPQRSEHILDNIPFAP